MTQKNNIATLVLILGASLLLLPHTVSAESSSDTNNRRRDREEVRAEIQEINTTRQQNRDEQQQLRQENRQETRSNVAENHANRLEKRFGLYYQRLSNIIERFQLRLAALKSTGIDTSKVAATLATAQTKLSDAKSKGEQAIAAFRAIDPAKFSEQKSQALAARDLANQARKLYLEVHQLIKAALVELKSLTATN